MRLWPVALLLLPLLSGCLDAGEVFGNDPDTAPCTTETVAHTYWLSEGRFMLPEPPMASGSTEGNGFTNTFLTEGADEWWSLAMQDGIRITGDVTLELWVASRGAPAPYVDQSTPEPSQGWQFFTQFGTERGFAPSYHNVYGDTYAPEGTVAHYTQTFTMPEGGLVVERGDHLRLLLTSLVLNGPDGGGSHDILWGGNSPSALTFEAVCFIDRQWAEWDSTAEPIAIAGHQGLLAGGTIGGLTDGANQQENLNFQLVPFTLASETERLTISLDQLSSNKGATKDDMDVSVLDDDGNHVWSIGSPYADEVGTAWALNLDAWMPPGDYTVRIDSYSGIDYEGTLTITQETVGE